MELDLTETVTADNRCCFRLAVTLQKSEAKGRKENTDIRIEGSSARDQCLKSATEICLDLFDFPLK